MATNKGTIRERPAGSGIWQLRVSTGRDPITGKYSAASKTFRGTENQARRELKDFVAEVEQGIGTSASVAAVLGDWVDLKRGEWAPSTLVTVSQIIDSKINPALGHKKVQYLTARDLDRFYGALTDSGCGASYVLRVHGVISAALNQARKWGAVSRNVARDASPPPAKRRPATERAPSGEDIERVGDELEPAARFFIHLAQVTGARRGELCALRWDDLDGDMLTIERGISQGQDGWVVKSTKTEDRRELHLDGLTLELWKSHRKQTVEVALQYGMPVPEWVFALYGNSGWSHWKPPCISSAWREARRRAGVSESIRLHDLRHFSATQLLAAGIDPVTVANRLGHSDPTTTLRVYAHPDTDADRGAAEVIGKIANRG